MSNSAGVKGWTACSGHGDDLAHIAALAQHRARHLIGTRKRFAAETQRRQRTVLEPPPWLSAPYTPVPTGECIMTTTATKPAPLPTKASTAGTGTIRLHRVLRAPAERVYKAFLDP